MEISPIRIFFMTVTALAAGACVGALNDLWRLVRTLLGVRYKGSHRFELLQRIRLPISKKIIAETEPIRAVKYCLPAVVFLQDILLFLSAGALVAVLNYYFNSGRARIFTPIAVICGAVLYYFTVGRAVLYFSDALTIIAKACFLSIFELFYYPIRRFVGFFGAFVKKIYTNFTTAIAKKRKMVYNNNREELATDNGEQELSDSVKSDLGGAQ